MNANLRVAIAGAGMGGLVAGLALLQNGFRVDIFEQAAELRGLGAGVQLSANGTRKRNVLIGLLTRKTNKQIARDMEISPRTVEVHRMDVMRRLSAQTLPQAVLKASAAGLHPFPPRKWVCSFLSAANTCLAMIARAKSTQNLALKSRMKALSQDG